MYKQPAKPGLCIAPSEMPHTTLTHNDVTTMAEVHKTPGIYTFLGLATLPRLRSPSNNLRHLPREIIQRIARFAHREHYFACFPLLGGAFAEAVDLTARVETEPVMSLRMAHPLRSGVTYVEVTTTSAWYGTRLLMEGVGQKFGLELGDDVSEEGSVNRALIWESVGVVHRVVSFGDECWTWCDEVVVFGALVDMVRGCVTFRLNGIDGPCVRFPGDEWRRPPGVWLTIQDFPNFRDDDSYPDVVVSCATRPVPPSLLVAAKQPKYASEYYAAGAFEDAGPL